MNRLDRYLLTQLLGPFGFFALALAGILWLAQVLPLIEIIIDSGKTGLIFLEFSVLILPNVLVIVLPIAAFISTIYAINRMYSETEMVVVMSAGLSPSRIAKAAIVFGTVVMGAMFVLILALQPMATTRLGDRTDQLRRDATAALLKERQFLHPADGLTVYIEKSSNVGEVLGLFMHDRRDPLHPITYSADEALLLQDGDELRFILSNGVMQSYDTEANTLNIVDFETFILDLTDIINTYKGRNRLPIEYPVSQLLNPQQILDEGGRRGYNTYFAEAHNKLALPFLGFTLPLIAAALLLTAKYRRSGFGKRITIISIVGMLTLTFTLLSKTTIIENPELYLISYLPNLLVLIAGVIILFLGTIKGGRPKQISEVS